MYTYLYIPRRAECHPFGGEIFYRRYFQKDLFKICKTNGWIIYFWGFKLNLSIFFIFNKKTLKGKSFRNILENHQEGNRLISFVHFWLYIAGIKIVCSFLKSSCYNLYMVHASQKWGDFHTNLFIFLNHLHYSSIV